MVTRNAITIFDIPIDLKSKEDICKYIRSVILQDQKAVIAYVNAYSINLINKYNWLKKFYQSANIVYADGQGVRFACWLLGKIVPPHLPLTVWIWDLLKVCEESNFSVYFIGSKEEVIVTAVANLLNRFPKIRIVGYHHGYFQKDGIETQQVVEVINTANPDILLVGFGMPIQEEWIIKNFANLKVHVILPVGGCIDVIAGRRKKVPKLVRKIGFEWLFRLIEEPKRLFVRYIIGNPKFIFNILKECLTKKQ